MKKAIIISSLILSHLGFSQVTDTGDKVGIGTTTPSEKLDVKGIISVGVPTGQYPFKIWSGGTGNLNHMRIGTDIGHPGDAVVELYQNYVGGGAQNPGKLIVNGNVGIGTTSPSGKLDVRFLGESGIFAKATSNGTHGASNFVADAATGFPSRFLFRENGTNKGWIDHHGGKINIRNNISKALLTVDISTENIGIGTTNPDAKLAVKGNIHTNEVKVDLLGAVAPDYVFYKDYNLKTLTEVENYITEKGHLPNIPSAKQMEEEGIKLKEMNLKLLEKIEELTLYTINQEKRIKNLESKNETFILLVEKLLEKTSEK